MSPNSVPSTSTRRLTDEMKMFGWQRSAVLGDDPHRRFAGDKKDETGRFLLGTSFPKPAVA